MLLGDVLPSGGTRKLSCNLQAKSQMECRGSAGNWYAHHVEYQNTYWKPPWSRRVSARLVTRQTKDTFKSHTDRVQEWEGSLETLSGDRNWLWNSDDSKSTQKEQGWPGYWTLGYFQLSPGQKTLPNYIWIFARPSSTGTVLTSALGFRMCEKWMPSVVLVSSCCCNKLFHVQSLKSQASLTRQG